MQSYNSFPHVIQNLASAATLAPHSGHVFSSPATGAAVPLKESAFVLKDADVMVLFASRFPELGINEEQEFIISLNDPQYACLFASNVVGADIEALEQIVIDSNDYKYAYNFACTVDGANIKKLEDIVVASNDRNSGLAVCHSS